MRKVRALRGRLVVLAATMVVQCNAIIFGCGLTFGLQQAAARACWRCGIDRERLCPAFAGIKVCRGYRGTRKPKGHQPIRVYDSYRN